MLLGFASVTRDLSERRRIEEVAQSNAELQQFVYIASHDLQEPLRAISAFLQLLKKRSGNKLDAEDKQYIGLAVNGALRMKMLVEALLAFARIGQSRGKRRPVDFNIAVRDAMANLAATIDETGAKFTIENLPTLDADSFQIVQLFQNILGNALKYRSEKTPEIRVSASQKSAHWLFAVEDNGIGVNPEYSERIFLPFQRLHNDSQKYLGTGIGLAICQKIVQQYSGRIWVESQPGRGATFFFTIPRSRLVILGPSDEPTSTTEG